VLKLFKSTYYGNFSYKIQVRASLFLCSSCSKYPLTKLFDPLDSLQWLLLSYVSCCRMSLIIIIVSLYIWTRCEHQITQFNHFLLHFPPIIDCVECWVVNNKYMLWQKHCGFDDWKRKSKNEKNTKGGKED
jgi:hypothetical protein